MIDSGSGYTGGSTTSCSKELIEEFIDDIKMVLRRGVVLRRNADSREWEALGISKDFIRNELLKKWESRVSNK